MRDLSHTIMTDMPVYPGDPAVTIESALTLERDGVAVAALHIGTHSGTHVDAPAHTVAGGRTIDDVLLDELVGEALVIRADQPACPLSPRQALGPDDLRLASLTRVPRIVVIATGWSRFFGEPEYAEHPFLTREAADRLWELGMRVLAVDVLSPDSTPSEDFPVHEAVLGRDGLIVENLTNLDGLEGTVTLGFFPVKLGALDGSPVRAVVL